MKVWQFVKLLQQFHDQDAEVIVVEHFNGKSVYDQGGNCEQVHIDPETHLEYTDFRGNPFMSKSSHHFNKRTLLIGSTGN